jgi:hypothetical protein
MELSMGAQLGRGGTMVTARYRVRVTVFEFRKQ